MTPPAYVLFYDGTCGLCRASARFVLWWGPRQPLRAINAADAQQLAHFPQINPHEAMQSVHLLRHRDGQVFRGYDAIVVLTAILPWFRSLAPLMATRPARWLGWKLYHWVTAHRHQLSNLLHLH